MKVSKFITGALLILLGFIACNKEDEVDPVITCDQKVKISEYEFLNAPDDQLVIDTLEINGDCLKITFSSGGCDGESWEIKLIDSASVVYTDPPQRNLRLSLKNEELCDAWITKEITFDISALHLGTNNVILNIVNSGDQITFHYK